MSHLGPVALKATSPGHSFQTRGVLQGWDVSGQKRGLHQLPGACQQFPQLLPRNGSQNTCFSMTSLSVTFGGQQGGVQGERDRPQFFGRYKGWDCELPRAVEQPQ